MMRCGRELLDRECCLAGRDSGSGKNLVRVENAASPGLARSSPAHKWLRTIVPTPARFSSSTAAIDFILLLPQTLQILDTPKSSSPSVHDFQRRRQYIAVSNPAL